MTSSSRHGLVWFRRDLRLSDNPAWSAATSEHRRVTALYVLDDRLVRHAGPHRRRQLLAELAALDASLRSVGGGLVVRRGDPADEVPREALDLGADRVHWNADYTPFATARDAAVRARLGQPPAIEHGNVVLEPGTVVARAGHVPRVFTAFHREWETTPWEPWPEQGDAAVTAGGGCRLPPLDGDPPHPAGESAAHDTLAWFLRDHIDTYTTKRDRIAGVGTSGLSVPLSFGTISPRRIVCAAGDFSDDRRAFVRQLAWRDWYVHLFSENPTLLSRAARPDHDGIEWRDDPDGFAAWQEGRTGYPIVDAGMRELTVTGRMHNRVRMVAASVLVKDLLIDWRLGERHFRRLLLDADVTQNVGNWQWVAGVGPDAAPYFRVFNPLRQSRRHDPHGDWLRRWLPELSGLDDNTIHAPWEAKPSALAAAGVVLGETYPAPIVDHGHGRLRALAAFRAARSGNTPTTIPARMRAATALGEAGS